MELFDAKLGTSYVEGKHLVMCTCIPTSCVQVASYFLDLGTETLEAGVVLVLGDHSCGCAQDEKGWGAFSEGLKIFFLTSMFIKKQMWRQQWRVSAIPPAVQPTG